MEGLGDFIELEVVLRPEQSNADGKKIANGLLAKFGIGQRQLSGEAYVDLLSKKVLAGCRLDVPGCRLPNLRICSLGRYNPRCVCSGPGASCYPT